VTHQPKKMTLDEMIAALQALRVDDAAGALEVMYGHPDSGWSQAIATVSLEAENLPGDGYRHIRIDGN
jgi:hypothetical protein